MKDTATDVGRNKGLKCEVIIVDRRRLPGDQDSDSLTQQLVSSEGAIQGYRCRLERYIDEDRGWVVIAEMIDGSFREVTKGE